MITKLFEYIEQSYVQDYINKYYLDGAGHLGYEDIRDRVIEFLNTDFPYGLQNIPEPLILYRLLNVKSQKDIKKDKLGKHYVGDKEMFDDEDFLDSASILNGNDKIENWYIVTIETNKDNLDIDSMLGNRAEYPTEFEFTIKDDKNIKIIGIEQIDNEVYKGGYYSYA